MRLNKAVLCLSALLVLGGCGDSEPPTPAPDAGTPRQFQVTVGCQPTTLVVGESSQCTASARYESGETVNGLSYTWSSSNEAVARVDPAGRVTTLTAGTADIIASATSETVTGQGRATLTVNRGATLHATDITANETWRAADNPHVVRGSLAVGGASAPTLTLEAGVELRFEQAAELRVTNGTLRAVGLPETGIRLGSGQSASSPGWWRGVVFSTPGSASELRYVTLSDCGNATGKGACIALENGASLLVDTVTVQDSATAGVTVADDGSAFAAASQRLSITRSGGPALRIGANQAGTLPQDSAFTANTLNVVELRGDVTRSQTWPNLNIPYAVAGLVRVRGEAIPTLTLAAGVVLRFASDSALIVGEASPGGNLVAVVTSDAPILFSADSNTPQPGHWRGVHLGRRSTNESRLSNVTIEYAGAAGSTGRGNLNIYGNLAGGGARPVITDVTVRRSSEYGVYLTGDGAFGPGSARLSARDNGRHHVGVEANYAYTIPTGGTFNESPGTVEIYAGNVGVTQTWPDLGVPYVISRALNVGSDATPTLTLLPGTEIRVAQDVGFSVGANSLPGVLNAVGTAERPIRFVPNVNPPTSGYWRGLSFWQATGSKLEHAVVSHAGVGRPGGGNVNVFREIGVFMTNTTLAWSSLCAVTLSDGREPGTTTVMVDFTQPEYNITFTNNLARQCSTIQ